MATRNWLTTGILIAALAGFWMLGNAGDGGCEMPKPPTADELCVRSGGTWGTPANWPTPCGKDPTLVKGLPTAPGESACTCPGIKPNWRDGEGCAKCDIGECTGTPWPCISIVFGACRTQPGCHDIDDDGWCNGSPLSCSGQDTRVGCEQIFGCNWIW